MYFMGANIAMQAKIVKYFLHFFSPDSSPGRFYRANPGEFWRFCLFWSFWLSLAFFPIGYGFREVMPPVCALFLIPYYYHCWPQTSLARLKPAWLFACAGMMTLLGVIFSIHPWASFLHAAMGLNKAYILPFIAMECAHTLNDIKRLAWACAFACFWQGLDGIWQAFTGYDFIMGYPYAGRLTGSLGDYTVGNYLALALVPAFGVWSILRARLSLPVCAFVCTAIFWPPFFLLLGASSRSAFLAIAVCLLVWALMRYGIRNPLWLLPPALASALFLLFQGYRFAPDAVLGDNRWDLWRLAWKVFEAHPWFGAGAGQYNAAFRELGLAPAREVITISHPHDLYLDILYAHGIIGFSLGMIFLLSFLIWGFKRIWPNLRKTRRENSEKSLYWRLTAWFWLGYLAWLVNGVFGHDFYRIWWLALAMCNLGIMAGAIVNGPAVGGKQGRE